MNAITKLIENLSQNSNVKRFLSDFDKLSQDLKKLQLDLNKKLNSEKESVIKKARSEYQKILSKVKTAEKDLNKEVNQAIVKIKKSADKVEKNLNQYKKKANQQKLKAEKILKGKATTKKMAAKPKAKISKKKTTRKA